VISEVLDDESQELGVAVAADVDDAKTVGLEGEKTSNYAIAADLVDAGTSTAELCDTGALEPGDVNYARARQGWKGLTRPN